MLNLDIFFLLIIYEKLKQILMELILNKSIKTFF